jgi:hypothetical protein
VELLSQTFQACGFEVPTDLCAVFKCPKVCGFDCPPRDVAAWSPEAIAQMTAVSPKDYVRVIGYPKDKGYPNLRIDNNDRAGVLENVVEFNTYAFAIVRGPDGRTMIRVPTTSTPELLRRIGTEVDLTGKQTDQENKRTRRTISLGRTR